MDKIENLRIGNLLQLSGGCIITVSNITKEYFYATDKDGIDFKNKYAQIEPIVINEKILLKLGFKWKNNGLRKNIFCIRQYGTGYAIFMSNESLNFIIELKYVHTLQNIWLLLSNENLTFKYN